MLNNRECLVIVESNESLTNMKKFKKWENVSRARDSQIKYLQFSLIPIDIPHISIRETFLVPAEN